MRMRSNTNKITEEYFEEKAKQELDLQNLILENMKIMEYTEVTKYSSYNDRRIIKYVIASEDINHDVGYITFEKVIRSIIENKQSLDKDFHEQLINNVQQIQDYSLNIHDGYIQLENYPNFTVQTNKWGLHRSKRVHKPEIKKDIEIANKMVTKDIPMLKGHMEEPTVHKYKDEVVYSIDINNLDEKVSFRFDNYDGIDEQLKTLTKIVGGSPEFIPGTELYIAPSWQCNNTIVENETGLWSLTTEKNKYNYKSFITIVKESLNL